MKRTTKLKRGTYNESTLVDKLCTDAQKKAYHEKERFPGGSNQKGFLDKLSACCDYKYLAETKKYEIVKVYEYPKTLAESRIHKGIYQYIAPLMLNHALGNVESENPKSLFVISDIAKDICLVNNKYNTIKSNQSLTESCMDISPRVFSEYFKKVDACINNYIRRCISYLESMNCIRYRDVYIIESFPSCAKINGREIIVKESEIRVATKEEIDLYNRLTRIADEESGIKSEQERWYGTKSFTYMKKIKSLLKDAGIAFIRKAYEQHVDKKRCREILATFNDMEINQREYKLGWCMKVIIDENTVLRYKRNPQKYCSDYVEQFKKLSEITLTREGENSPFIDDFYEKDYQKRMQSKYGLSIRYQ